MPYITHPKFRFLTNNVDVLISNATVADDPVPNKLTVTELS